MEALEDFLYELKKYAGQTHTLKETYEKLNEAEKRKVMDAAPDSLQTPEEVFQPVFTWLESMYKILDIEEDEKVH
jgi:hypothetical protein